MKIRKDFITNSSSSSFIISKDDISRDRLIEILLEIANEEATWPDESESYNDYNEIADRYEITESTPEAPYEAEDWFGYTIDKYTNHFIVDNNSICRYDWDAVEDVLGKYNIPWISGYCD